MILRQLCLLLFGLIIATNVQGKIGPVEQHIPTISHGTDVIFVLDASERVTSQHWTYLKTWLQQLVEYWHIGPSGVQVSFYTYGNGAHLQWSLQQASDYQQVVQEIQALRLYGGSATVGQAVRQAYLEGFSADNGGRAGVSKIIVQVNSGPAADPSFWYQEIQDAKQRGVAVYNIGIGPGAVIVPADVSKVASEPSHRYVLSSQNYMSLDSLTSSLAARIADELPAGEGASLPPAHQNGCLQKADVVFLLDGSSSVGSSNFQRLLNYVKTFSSQLPVSQPGVHVGLVQFSSRPSVEFGLDLYTDRASLLKGIDNIQYLGGGTNTADALQVLRTQMFSQGMGARSGVPRIAVVITDGRSSSMTETVKEADLLRQDSVSIIAVGVGSGVNTVELRDIADSQDDVFEVNGFNDLPGITQNLQQRTCQAQATVAPLSATVDPSVTDPCQDTLPNCNQYTSDMCTNYAAWARDNCLKTCQMCQPILPDILPPCVDKVSNCENYDINMCSELRFRAWALDNCPLFCGLCGAHTASNGYYGQCFYKGETYNTGETWQDGCDYECTCVNGATGQYRCYNKCPLYSQLPGECTLVQTEGECCLKPVCNFNPTIQTSITSGRGTASNGMAVCVHDGGQYMQGESWDVGCSQKCHCQDSNTGEVKCQDYCPTYQGIPSICRMEQKAGQCCSEPVCEFTTQTGVMTGHGQTSGNGAVAQPTDAPPCVDKLDNCQQYERSACEAPYLQWAEDNCRKYCDLCSDGAAVPTEKDTCMYNGTQYRQGEKWTIGCDQECVCEQAVYGYYRCYSLCPTYTNIPAQCTRTPASAASCCETITCPQSSRLVASATNLFSIGAGSYIQQPNPQSPGMMVPVVPTVNLHGAAVNLNTPYQGYQPPAVQGCLYKGQLYVQGQRWDDGCQQVCECTSASQGLYSCSSRCPTYTNLPRGCYSEPDPSDACCTVAKCQPTVHYVPVPVFTVGTVSSGVAQPPNPMQLMATSSTIVVTQRFGQSGNSPPTMPTGPVPTGGIGYCIYKNQTYRQSETWRDGCDYNCLCEDASVGFWRCADLCLTYPIMPQYCRLVQDPDFPCCTKPYCEIPGVLNSTFGHGSTHSPIVTSRPPMVITSTTPPKPAMCTYKGLEYGQGQEWYDNCAERCTCYDAVSNLYSCTDRCPTFYGLDMGRCTMQPDPRDPVCCSIPICVPPSTSASGTTAVPTVPGGSFENTDSPGFVGYCDYKGTHYQQDDRWEDGCQYVCECVDAAHGRYRCDERCPRFPNLPAACHLVPDFANPCCRKPTCDFTGHAEVISGHAHLHTPAPVTPGPGGQTPVCVYNGVNYNQGQTWEDGCHFRCRCEDAGQNLHVCSDRCARFESLPAQCVLVTDPSDQCCLIPQCSFHPTSGQHTGQAPTPFPTYPPGHITGEVSVPTPGPGLTPVPVGYCVYKGQQYSEGQAWNDGCDYSCRCVDASTGRYLCDERCPKFPNLPPQCRLLKDPAHPCCVRPDCSFTPGAGEIPTPNPSLQSTVTPVIILPGQSTVTPIPQSTLTPPVMTPSPTPVCVYRGQAYAEGQTWYDGCDFVCVCEEGSQGTYRCNDRCPSYPVAPNANCTMVPNPSDPMCCRIPRCEAPQPTPLGPNGVYIVPPLGPQGVVTGGSVTVTPTPSLVTVSPPHGSTLSPPTGPGGSTLYPPLTPPQPKAVCIYKGQDYTQGQKWQDGCDYDCECVDASSGQYRCVEMCLEYPPVPQGCYMVKDVYKPCCETPVCPFPPTLPPVITPSPHPVTTLAPPTGPDGHTLQPPVITAGMPSRCVYNGVPYRTGDTWEDGCDLRCRCEDETSNVYRCDQRCARYQPSAGCTLVTDPRDTCCLAPYCEPQLPPTVAPPQNANQTVTLPPIRVPIPTAIPGIIVGNSVGSPNKNRPNNETMCMYNGALYRQGDTWVDGCDRICGCVDQTTGRYRCKERCPQYLNVPPYCTMMTDPDDPCCEKPECATPHTVVPGLDTIVPSPQVTSGVSTPVPRPQSTQVPNPNHTPVPLPRSVCTYKNAVYVEGQHWYDGCDKVCVCEDGSTGYYRCTDRCKMFDNVPAGCTLVMDPKDPACCRVPQCVPVPGLTGYPTPPAGQSPTPFTVTNVPGIVTGRAPTPTPGTDGKTPPPINACVYKGHRYAQGQAWQDGCDYKCVCQNENTGEYRCTERCSSYPLVPPQCRLTRDPADFCCQVMTCDPNLPTPNPFLTPTPLPTGALTPDFSQTTTQPTTDPNHTLTPRPIPTNVPTPNPNLPVTVKPTTAVPRLPTSFCVYQGVPYRQGATWQEGCSKTCRCEDADNNYYTCFDRCPKYNNLDPKCTLTLDPNDNCCTMPVCPDVSTVSPTLGPGMVPTPTPYAVPHKVPTGSITGSKPDEPNTNTNNREGRCVYNSASYRRGETWDDGCEYTCTCIDEDTGRYVCDQKCEQYTDLPPYCVLVKYPGEPCCMTPVCTPPVTPTPSGQHSATPPSGQSVPPGVSTLTPVLHVTPPVNPNKPQQPPTIHPQSSACTMNGHSYTQGQQWYDGCSRVCVCENGATGFYTCRQRCPDYPDSDPTCLVVPDPSDPACCTIPQCTNPNNPDLPTGHKGTITGTAKPPVPLAGTTLAPLPGHTMAPHPGSTQVPQPRDVCLYKGQEYSTGQRWRDGCDYDCVCEDGATGRYKCTDRCPNYPAITAPGCRMERDPSDPCCQTPTCSPTQAPTLIPNVTPGTVVCVYQGVPYRQGQTWTDGCDKVCRCEDGSTGLISCDDRCPSYPNTQAGCRMVTDPQDSCCQMPQCENPNTNIPTKVITGVPGTTEGHLVPPQNPNPLQPRPSVCVYRGVRYNQGQQWNDGCSYTCVCEDGVTGHYVCTERCARVPIIPPTCQQVPDPADLCCQVVSCPVATTPTTHPYTGPSTIAPPLGTTLAPTPGTMTVPQPRPGFCLYKNQYYREQQMWYDGCDAVCTCEDANTGFYRCQERCGDYQHVDSSCILVADPKDPTCCTMPECPLIPPGGTTPSGPAILRPPLFTASFTNFPTPTPRLPVTQSPPLGPDGHTLVPPVASTQTPSPRTGCLYKGHLYQENEQWDDGCDFNCMCLSDSTGQYKCSEKCGRVPSVPKGCVLIQDPQNTCCQVPYCDFGPHPFPSGIPTPKTTQEPSGQSTPSLVVIPGFVTPTGGHATTPSPTPGGSSNVCVYQGVVYNQGQGWDEGCEKTCVCEVNGLYTCKDRCQSYPQLDPACVLRTNPADPCCLVPECNPHYVTPAPGSSSPVMPSHAPDHTGTRVLILVPTAAPGILTGQRAPIPGNVPSLTGYSNMCVYKGSSYNQGETWEDGCQYKCECTDAIRGVYRCTERCSSMYFMPPSCTLRIDPDDSCCQVAYCSPDAFPTPTPRPTNHPTLPHSSGPGGDTPSNSPGSIFPGTRSPVGNTVRPYTGKPADKCVYTDGRTFSQGEQWTDGCAYTCTCHSTADNFYSCDFRCPVYSELPSFCHMATDPQDSCCQKVECTPVQGKPLEPVIAGSTPTLSPTMAPGITNIVPIGTHTLVSGSRMPPGEATPGFFGGRQVCVYNGTIYQPGDKWDDGCDFTCHCLEREPTVYSCTSKCPRYPPLPQYCSFVDVPGQCCPSMRCDIPHVGSYHPIPQLYPNLIPTQSPLTQPGRNPQLVVVGGYGPITGGTNPPGGGYQLPGGYNIGGISDRCVYQGIDQHFRVYEQGETWTVDTCGYNCECKDAHSGYYVCRPVCPDYNHGNLPPTCSLQYVAGQCCKDVRCTNPDGSITDPVKNPGQTLAAVYGVISTGYSGFRPGHVPGFANSIGGRSNVCVFKGKAYATGSHWDDGCDYSCECTDGDTGLYICTPKCEDYTALPPSCHLVTKDGNCCPKVQCIPSLLQTHSPAISTGVTIPDCSGSDRLPNCAQYEKAVACVGMYEPWARDNCPLYCGYCRDPHPTIPGPCVDTLTNCDHYDIPAVCSGPYLGWARDNCAKSCNLCPCNDILNNCDQYGDLACRAPYEDWAHANCAQSCGYCSGPGRTTPSVTTPGASGIVPDGWTLLLKGVAGAPGDLWNLWSSSSTANTNVPAAQHLTNEYMGHYKSPLALSLDMCDFDKMQVAVYNGGHLQANVIFDGHGTDRDSWFDAQRILDSTFSDIRTGQQLFQMARDPATGHEFYIGQPVSGCSGSGWIMVSTLNTCPQEQGTNPGFYYSSTGTSASFSSGNLQSGDVFAIMGQGGSCSTGIATAGTFTHHSQACVYKDQIYSQDDWWQDGCQYNCTCEDASRGVYRCYNLCLQYPNLPSQCSLVKEPGECCAKPVGPGCSHSGGCLYKDHVYQHGQSWDDGCDYTCTCQDGDSGQYQCSSMCPIFALPDVCHMNDPPPGMCCPTPECPAGITIQYPEGYVPR